MKKYIAIWLTMLAMTGLAQLSFQVIDTTTLHSGTSSSTGLLTAVGLGSNVPYSTTNPAYQFHGDLLPAANAKINGNFAQLSTAVTTTNATANGQVAIATNTGGTGYAYYWGTVASGGAVTATNAIASTNGVGTATTIVKGISLGATNVAIQGIGPNAGTVTFPRGLTIEETGPGLTPENATDSGLVGGYGMGEVSGEIGSIEFGSTNDILGGAGPQVMSATIGGGLLNFVGDSSGHGYGSYSVVGGGLSNTVVGTGSTISGGQFNRIGDFGSAFYPANGSVIPGGISNVIASMASNSTAAGSQALVLYSNSYVWNDDSAGTFSNTASGQYLIHASGGVGIGTNNPGPFGLTVVNGLNFVGGLWNNGAAFTSGTAYTNNSTGNAGSINGSGIGTNIPVQPFSTVAGSAFTDTNGLTLASLVGATNAAQGLFAGAVSNLFGLATNLSAFTYVTNVLSVTYVTNGNNVIATYTAVIQTILQTANTNTFTLYDAGTVAANGTYTWVPSVAAYTNTAAQFGCRLTGGFYTVFNNVGATLYSAFPGSVFLGTIFPSVWGNDGGVNPSPLGYFQTTSGPGITFTNTYRVIVTTAQTVDTGNNQFALSVNQKMTASGYYFNNVTLQSVFQGMMFPYLFVTNCAGTATNFQGPFGNTWLGFYTNTANGTLLIPGGYVGSSIDGTNFSTSISLLCSNLTSLRQNLSFYSNTNVTGLYSVNFGHDAMATNQPLVSIYTPLTGLAATYSTNATLVAATTLTVNFSPAMPDTSYIVTAPNNLVGVTVTSRGTSSFVWTFTSATFTSQTLEGAVIHR